MVDPRMFAPADLGSAYAKGLQIREHQERRQDKKRLADLIPQAMGRGGMDESGAVDQRAAIEQMYGIDPQLAMKLDDRQREQAKAELDDLSAAVRWADDPQKWEHVKQHFGQKGVDLTPYGFEDRERGLLALGQLGEYLKTIPKPEYRSIEAGGSLIDVSGGNPRVVIAPNPGDQPMGAPAQQGSPQNLPRVSSPEEARRLPPGSKFIMPDGRVGTVPGGPTASQSGGFPY